MRFVLLVMIALTGGCAHISASTLTALEADIENVVSTTKSTEQVLNSVRPKTALFAQFIEARCGRQARIERYKSL